MKKTWSLEEDFGGSAPRNLGISEQSCLLFGRNGAPNQLLGIQQLQWLHFYLLACIPFCRPSLLRLLGPTPGSPEAIAAFINKDAMTDHACLEKPIGVFKTALNHIWVVSINRLGPVSRRSRNFSGAFRVT